MPEPEASESAAGRTLWIAKKLNSMRPDRRNLRADILAGLPGAVASVPDGMAASVLAGISPAHGLYASFAGPLGGGLSTSTRYMVITTTSAAALAAGSAVATLPASDRGNAVILITLMAGAAMVVAGLLRLGRYARFVSHSVMTGFLTGVAINIFLGQIPDLTGVHATGSTSVAKAWNVITHPTSVHVASLLVGLAAIAILIATRTGPLATVGAVLALAVPTIAATILNASVATVSDAGMIPTGLPIPSIPSVQMLSIPLITSALAIAAIVLVQGFGVSQSSPNPGGAPSNANQDFIAQGVGNVASGFFAGMPVGGSVSQTALNRESGARSRWASIFIGLWMLLILVVFSPIVGRVMMPTLAGVLMVAAYGSLRPAELVSIARSNYSSAIAAGTTLLATLILPVTAAVGIGVALSLLLQVNREAMDLRIVELVPRDGGLITLPGPVRLHDNAVTMVDVYGSVLYAGARTLQTRLPDPSTHHRPAVIIRMRGRSALGVTFNVVIEDYARRLERVGGRLFLSGLEHQTAENLKKDNRFAGLPIDFIEAVPRLGWSSTAAYDKAQAWARESPSHEEA